MKKICIISPSFHNMNCGLAGYVANLAKLLSAKKIDVSVLTPDNPKIKEYMKSAKDDTIKIYPIISCWNFSALFLIKKEVRKFGYDTVHIMYHWNGFNQGILKGLMVSFLPFFLKANRTNSPVIAISFVHDIMGPYLFPKAGPLRKLALFFMVIFADRITVHTEYQNVELIHMFPFLKERIYRIPCGSGVVCDLRLQAESNNGNLKQEKATLSFFGYIYPSKGLEYLIEAIKILRQKEYKIKLLIIGGLKLEYKISHLAAYHSKIKKLIFDYGLDSCIEWLGFCKPEDVSRHLLNSDICVLPFTEGVNDAGSSFNTALLHGLPLVTTRGPYIPRMLIDRENVSLVPPRNSHLLARAIEELICDGDLRKKISLGARKLYDKEYSWSAIVDKTIDIYYNANQGLAWR